MNEDLLFEKAHHQFLEKLPFVLYKKPETQVLIGVFQQENMLHFVKNYTEKGYVFAPFDGDEVVLIPISHSEIITTDFVTSAINFTKKNTSPDNPETKNSHINLVKKAIKAIETGAFSKLVISRKELVDVPDFDFAATYKILLDFYPDAFSYCFFHPEIGLWMGAFSEQLLKTKGSKLHTMAVAGTQKWDGSSDITWGEKEKKEQELVTGYIFRQLEKVTSHIQVSSPYTLIAGKLAHIKTNITADLYENVNLKSVIKLLHPTPAVCGLPKEAAKQFILENENYHREYYSGFHGELNIDFATKEQQTDLYVNLRCMKIETASAKAVLFIGGGITKDSDPEKEWTETVNKSHTMKQVINANYK